MNQFGATLLIVETLFIQTVNGPGTGEGEGSNIRRRMCVRARARCRTRIGESAYFRVYIPPIQEFITLDSTLTEIYRIRNRLEGRREYQAFRFGGSSSSRTTWISRSTRSQHHRPVCRPATPLLSLSLSICLSLSFLSDNERQNESFLSSWPSLDRRKNWQGEGFLGRDAPYLFSLRRIEIESVLDAGMKFDFFAVAHGRNSR